MPKQDEIGGLYKKCFGDDRKWLRICDDEVTIESVSPSWRWSMSDEKNLPLWATLIRLSVVALGAGICVLGAAM